MSGSTDFNFSYNSPNQKGVLFFLKTLIDILEALKVIHSYDYMHGKIKANNILIDTSNKAKILDFDFSSLILKQNYTIDMQEKNPFHKRDLHDLSLLVLEVLDDFKLVVESDKYEIFHNICKKMQNNEYANAQEVIFELQNFSLLFETSKTYEINMNKQNLEKLANDFNKSPNEMLNYLNDLSKNSIRYAFYNKDDNKGRPEIVISLDGLTLHCGGKEREERKRPRDNHLYLFRHARRIDDNKRSQSEKLHKEHFIFSCENPIGDYDNYEDFVARLKELSLEREKNNAQKSVEEEFLKKTKAHLEIERLVLERKNISCLAKILEHKRAKKELKILLIEDAILTLEHLKDKDNIEDFSKKLVEDGVIETEYSNPKKLIEALNEFIANDIEHYTNDTSNALQEQLKQKYQQQSPLEKQVSNLKKLLDKYSDFLTSFKGIEKFFKLGDKVLAYDLSDFKKPWQSFTIHKVLADSKQVILTHDKEISDALKDRLLKISFDYDVPDGILRKQEMAIKDLENDNSVIDNLLKKLSHPNLLDGKKIVMPCEDYFNKDLDENQRLAVDKALNLNLGEYLIVQGPPGTGKTTVILEMILQILKKDKHARILVTSQSNQALDNVLDKICETEERIIRFGKDKNKMSKKAQKYHEEHTFDAFLQNLRLKIEKDTTDYGNALNEVHEVYKQKILNSDNKLKAIFYKQMRVLFGTLVGISGWSGFREMAFDYVIVDEAAKALLSELIIPLRKARRFILLGDHKQLPPYIDDEITEEIANYSKKDLQKTYFEEVFDKLEENSPYKHFLEFNYRAHKSIAYLYSAIFYDNKLKTKEDLIREHGLSFKRKVITISTSKSSQRFERQSGSGKCNDYNAKAIFETLKKVNMACKKAGLKKSVGIITPYLAQRDVIRKVINKKELDCLEIDTNSVDAFQGSDRDIIVYDFVRSAKSTQTSISFIADERRLNVSLSRAKELLFIVGDIDFIENVEDKNGANFYKELIKILKSDKEHYELVDFNK